MENSGNDINLIKAFAKKSRNDLKSAEVLLNYMSYADASYHAQQCTEKIIKCVLILNNKFVRTHIVSNIFEGVVESIENEEWKSALKNLIPDVIEIEEHWVLPRYPEPSGDEIWDPVDYYTEDVAKDVFNKAKRILDTITKFIKEYYSIEL